MLATTTNTTTVENNNTTDTTVRRQIAVLQRAMDVRTNAGHHQQQQYSDAQLMRIVEQLEPILAQPSSLNNQEKLDLSAKELADGRVLLKKCRLRLQARRQLQAATATAESPIAKDTENTSVNNTAPSSQITWTYYNPQQQRHHQQQRDALLTQYHSLSRQQDRLADTMRVAAETETIGQDTLAQLKMQREQLERADVDLDRTEAQAQVAEVRLKRMLRRRRRMYWGLLAGLLVISGILAGVLAWWAQRQP